MADFNNNDALASFLENSRTLVAGRWFAGQVISLDGYHFSRCRFDNCQLRYESGDFQITSCFFNNISVAHPPQAIAMFRLFFAQPDVKLDNRFAQFVPLRHPDGTITINDRMYI